MEDLEKPQVESTEPVQPDDLNALLSEWDQKPATAEPAEADTRLAKAEAEVQQSRHDNDVTAMLGTLKLDDRLAQVKDDHILAILDAKAAKDVRLQTAWGNRQDNPDLWARTLRQLGAELGDELGNRTPDGQIGRDKEALNAAVRVQPTGLSSDTLSNEALAELSDSEIDRMARGR